MKVMNDLGITHIRYFYLHHILQLCLETNASTMYFNRITYPRKMIAGLIYPYFFIRDKLHGVEEIF